ncbi:hypothetical protein D3C80_1622550 [compost metagenome]
MQRFSPGAVHKQFKRFTLTNAIGPVRIGNRRAPHRYQVVAVVNCLVHISGIDHAAYAHDRDLRERV